MDPSTMYLTAFLIIGGIIFLVLFFHYVPFFLWLSAKVSGVNISLVQLFLMRIRNVPPYIIVPGMIEAHKAGLQSITRDELEAHYLAGGHVERVVHALVSASKANIELPFQMATAIDLAGRDVFEAVQMSVNPKVIDTPPVTAVAAPSTASRLPVSLADIRAAWLASPIASVSSPALATSSLYLADVESPARLSLASSSLTSLISVLIDFCTPISSCVPSL